MSPAPLCKNCGGGLPQHQEGPCWCKTCMEVPRAERCTEYVPRPPKTASKDDGGFGKKPPKPPKKAPKSMTAEVSEQSEALTPEVPESGTPQRTVFDLVRVGGDKGCTDEDVALKTGETRSTVAFLRNELVLKGLLWDSGVRRRDSKGHENVVWSALPPEASTDDDVPLLVRDDVYVSQEGNATVLHAGLTRIRLSSVPGDPVEVTTLPRGADPDQEGGPQATVLLVVEGSEDIYNEARNPFVTPGEIVEMMADVIAPGINALTAVRKDL